MTQILALHSYRGGTGKTNVAGNLAAELVRAGRRVALVDADIQSPGIHVLFEVDVDEVNTLNDFLWGRCAIDKVAVDVTHMVARAVPPVELPGLGHLSLLPASLKAVDIARVVKEGYEVELLNEGLISLCRSLALDYLILDTHPGLNNETLLSIAISDIALILLRPDHQDYQGTAVTMQLARRLEVPRIVMAVNKVHPDFDTAVLSERISETYGAEVGAMILMSDELVRTGSSGLVSLLYPQIDFSRGVRQLATALERDASVFPAAADEAGQ
ncbi:MinD/ParA family ATP-binding protein [Roseixanthobacter pseudopolyaromaticivorans]|uniref:MinD/ParA family ATP-binding protein n=1 Tax=Xanthobacteraceae TaxID=335928 RepID=UPI00372B54BE